MTTAERTQFDEIKSKLSEIASELNNLADDVNDLYLATEDEDFEETLYNMKEDMDGMVGDLETMADTEI